MFTFRAEYGPPTAPVTDATRNAPPAPSDYYVTNGVTYEVRKITEEQCGMGSAGVQPAYMYPQKQVTLLDSGQSFPDGRMLYVGHCATFDVIYVMNEAGRTIDTIRVP